MHQTVWLLVLILVVRKYKFSKRRRRSMTLHRRVVHGARLGILAQGM
jgi:hypothetical protein